ncbi:MAG: DUF3596 domain-containing protein [Sphingobacteriia bacterium]|nr:DUF3596 domain-containing protein [Sphingobacteriia bacterium]
MGIKNQKGTVSVENYRDRIRLRWRYQNKRYSLSLYKISKQNLLQARKTALEIEQDITLGSFDITLLKYGAKDPINKEEAKSILSYFEEWVSV